MHILMFHLRWNRKRSVLSNGGSTALQKRSPWGKRPWRGWSKTIFHTWHHRLHHRLLVESSANPSINWLHTVCDYNPSVSLLISSDFRGRSMPSLTVFRGLSTGKGRDCLSLELHTRWGPANEDWYWKAPGPYRVGREKEKEDWRVAQG